jgi:hypothetical protein
MDVKETKEKCDKILDLYKNDPEEGHIWEDVFMQKFLKTLVKQVQMLSCDADDVKELQKTVGECMNHIDDLLHANKTKWYS